MKPISWACSRLCLAALLLLALCAGAISQPLRPGQADVVFSTDLAPPAAAASWQRVDLPFSFDQPSAWFRVAFEAPQPPPDQSWAVYLPYFYGGGRLFLN